MSKSDSSLVSLLKQIDAVSDGAAPGDGVPTGFRSLDVVLGGGMRAGDLVVLGGDVGAGKSALALAVALRAAASGRKVHFLTGEMTPERLLERALAIEGRASIDGVRAGKVDDETRAALGAVALRFRDRLPSIARLTSSASKAASAVARNTAQWDLVVVDGLQSFEPGDAPRDEAHAAAVASLKRAALDGSVPVLLTAQLPGVKRDRTDPRPTIEDFGALGAVKELADVILALFREEQYRQAPGQEGATELAILKNRHGGLSYIDLYFYSQWLRFEDMEE